MPMDNRHLPDSEPGNPSPQGVLEMCGAWIGRCARRLHDRMPWGEVDDLTQQGIMTAIEIRETWDYRRSVPFLAYAKPRVFGSMIDMLRQVGAIARNSLAVGQELWGDGEEPMTEQSALDIIIRAEDTDSLAAQIEVLPYPERTVISLFYLEELTNREVARIMSITEVKATRLRQRALDKLARGLADRAVAVDQSAMQEALS